MCLFLTRFRQKVIVSSIDQKETDYKLTIKYTICYSDCNAFDKSWKPLSNNFFFFFAPKTILKIFSSKQDIIIRPTESIWKWFIVALKMYVNDDKTLKSSLSIGNSFERCRPQQIAGSLTFSKRFFRNCRHCGCSSSPTVLDPALNTIPFVVYV